MKRINFLQNATRLAMVALCVVLVLASCRKDPEKPAIEVTNDSVLKQTVYADETNGKSDVTFVTTGAWTSSITEETDQAETATWVSIDPNRGDAAGTYPVSIHLEPNYTGDDRSAIITIMCNGMDIAISVTQKGTKEDGTLNANITMTTTKSLVSFILAGTGKATVYWDDGTNETRILDNKYPFTICIKEYSSGTDKHTITITGSNITYLNCCNNQLTNLNVTGCPALTRLLCYNNQLTNLDVNRCPALIHFFVAIIG